MQQAVAPCPEIIMSIKGKPTRSLLDSGSEVTLVNESYFREYIEHQLLPSSGSYNNSHNLFSLRGVEEGHVPLSKHFECDIEVGGQLVHRVGILVKKDKIPLVDSKGRKAKTPALLGSNLIRIVVNEFCETFGEDAPKVLSRNPRVWVNKTPILEHPAVLIAIPEWEIKYGTKSYAVDVKEGYIYAVRNEDWERLVERAYVATDELIQSDLIHTLKWVLVHFHSNSLLFCN